VPEGEEEDNEEDEEEGQNFAAGRFAEILEGKGEKHRNVSLLTLISYGSGRGFQQELKFGGKQKSGHVKNESFLPLIK
jgi:hypothetical protein